MKSETILDPGFGKRREQAPQIWILRSVGAQISLRELISITEHSFLIRLILTCLISNSSRGGPGGGFGSPGGGFQGGGSGKPLLLQRKPPPGPPRPPPEPPKPPPGTSPPYH